MISDFWLLIHESIIKHQTKSILFVSWYITNNLTLDLYLIEKVLDVLDVFQVLWVLELVLVLENMKKYLYLTQVLRKVLDPNPGQYYCVPQEMKNTLKCLSSWYPPNDIKDEGKKTSQVNIQMLNATKISNQIMSIFIWLRHLKAAYQYYPHYYNALRCQLTFNVQVSSDSLFTIVFINEG